MVIITYPENLYLQNSRPEDGRERVVHGRRPQHRAGVVCNHVVDTGSRGRRAGIRFDERPCLGTDCLVELRRQRRLDGAPGPATRETVMIVINLLFLWQAEREDLPQEKPPL